MAEEPDLGEFERLRRAESSASRVDTNPETTLSKMKIPFRAPSLIDKSKPYFSGIRHFGVPKMGNFFADPFHTLLNMPWGRFVLLFFTTYMLEFLVFAVVFYLQGDNCIIGMEKFSHALWMSSRTASTLGFDFIAPNPECSFTNVCVMVEVISASLINFIMLGLVFARFSAPFKRASTVRFSKNAVIHRHSSGYWCISMRVANLRKHQILQPSVRMVVTATGSSNITPSNYTFEHLKIDGTAQQMDSRMMEVLVFVDGIDAMTSKHMSAKTAYYAVEILLNEMHAPLHLEMRGKQLGLDFADYDATVPAWLELDNMVQAEVIEKGEAAASLRKTTFKQLYERFAHVTPGRAIPVSNVLPPTQKAASAHDKEEDDPNFLPMMTIKPRSTLSYGPPVVPHLEAEAAAASTGCYRTIEETAPFPRYEGSSAGGAPSSRRHMSTPAGVLPAHLMDPELIGPAPYATGPSGVNPFSTAASGHDTEGKRIPLPTSNAPYQPPPPQQGLGSSPEDNRFSIE
eukprot:gene20355-27120_t